MACFFLVESRGNSRQGNLKILFVKLIFLNVSSIPISSKFPNSSLMKWLLRNQSQCSCNALNIYTTTCFFKQVCFPPSLPPSLKIQVFYHQQNKINKQNPRNSVLQIESQFCSLPSMHFFLH